MRNCVGFMCVYPPTNPHYCSKMVGYVDFRYIAKGLKVSRIFVFILYLIGYQSLSDGL